MPPSQEELLGEDAQAALDRMLEGKRFVFLGEPEHFILEKYPFRLTFIRHLFARGWRHVAMETGRSVGWHVDRYLDTGDPSFLRVEAPDALDRAIHNRVLGFVDEHDNRFHQQLCRISESRQQNEPRLRYWGYDLDLGMPLGSLAPIRSVLEECNDDRLHELLQSVDEIGNLSTDEQMARVKTIRSNLVGHDSILTSGMIGELQSWLGFLQDSIAAEKRPRENQDLRGHLRWRAERERLMMRYLDEIVDALRPDGKLILMGHNGHLSKDTSNLHFRPQRSRFWGLRSWLHTLGYEAYSRLTRCPLSIEGDSVGSHLYKRFPGQVLSIWMLYGQGTLMTRAGPRRVRLHGDTVESLLTQAGDRFLLPLNEVEPQARMILSNANVRSSGGGYASTDLTAQADAIYFVKQVNAV